jgi:hypothetical protein
MAFALFFFKQQIWKMDATDHCIEGWFKSIQELGLDKLSV